MPDPSEEPWGDLVVVADSQAPDASIGRGHYALVHAWEWCEAPDEMMIWRGPNKPNELVKKERLREVSCKNLLVDADGFFTCTPLKGDLRLFYPCPITIEDLSAAVQKSAEKFLEIFANERAAEALSYVSDDLNEDYEGEVWITASVGDSVAINGELQQTNPEPPAGYVLTDKGGRMMGGEEEEIDKESLVDPVTDEVGKELETKIDPWTVRRILDQIWDGSYVMWNSDSGESEVWASRRIHEKLEEAEERKAEEAYARRSGHLKEYRERQAEERRAKIRKGGFPGPRDWSPRGKLPGE